MYGRDDWGTKVALAYRSGRTWLSFIAERLRYATPGGALRRDASHVALTRQSGAYGLRLVPAKAMDGKGGEGERIGGAGPDTGALHATLGYDDMLSKHATVFAFDTRIHNGRRKTVDFAINALGRKKATHRKCSALGVRYSP